MPEPLWIYLMALLYFTNVTTCSPRSRSQVKPCEFCVRRGDLFSIGSERWTKVSFERQQCCSHHAHNAMQNLWGSPIADTFCPHPPPMGILTLAHRLGYSPLRRKMPHVRLVPLNVSDPWQTNVQNCTKRPLGGLWERQSILRGQLVAGLRYTCPV